MFKKIFKKENQNRELLLKKWLESDFSSSTISGYHSLSENSEVKKCVDTIADLVSMMTIKLYANEEKGDIRVKNELSKKIDIYPNKRISRKNLIYIITRDLVLYGNSYALVKTKDGLIDEIVPIAYQNVSQTEGNYFIDGKKFNNEDLLHFMIHPDEKDLTKGKGLQVYLKDVLKSIKAANHTKLAFTQNKFNPSIIVRVDATDEVLLSEEGQKRLKEKYLDSVESGTPFFIPSELFEINTIKPLTLNDIALKDNVEMDKIEIATTIGIPLFLIGLGQFDKEEYNAFISKTIMLYAKTIEHELTSKLLYASNLYFKLSPWSLYQYNLQELASVGSDLKTKGLMTGNEVRNWLGLEPLEELDELSILENYIPVSKIGEQSKLKGGEADED